MRSLTSRWLVGALCLGLLAWGCSGTDADKDAEKSRRGQATVEDEAYVLPPLSAFEPFPGNIESDLTAKCATAGFPLDSISRTPPGSRQSVHARFNTSVGVPGQEQIIAICRLMGDNFASVARIVLEFQGDSEPVYYVVTGTKLDQFLGKDPMVSLTLEEFWRTLEHEVTAEPVAEDGKAKSDSVTS